MFSTLNFTFFKHQEVLTSQVSLFNQLVSAQSDKIQHNGLGILIFLKIYNLKIIMVINFFLKEKDG